MNPEPRRRSRLGAVFALSLVATLGVLAVLSRFDSRLRGPSAPLGIVSFELAGANGVRRVLDGWNDAQRLDALFVQRLDYLFLVLYATTIASAALLVARRLAPRHPRAAALGRRVAWGICLAALLDAVENAPMISMLSSGVVNEWGANVSSACASLKFALVALCLFYLLAALPFALRQSRAP
ncbi:MAG: hypothetical protein U0263_20605 [Polyangiaceae bacterium]